MIDLILKFVLTFFVSGFLLFPTSDKQDKNATNNYDKNGKKSGKWLYFGKDIPQANYPDENLVMEGEYKEGKREGTWRKYHKDGKTLLFVGDYQNNKPHGRFKKFNSDGFLTETGNFYSGKYNGLISKYYDNGFIMYKGEFYQGIENGEFSHYDKSGKVELSYHSYNGVVSKEMRNNEVNNNEAIKSLQQPTKVTEAKADENTTNLAPLIANPRVKNGSFNANGYNKIYNDKDDILQDGTFKNGRLFDGKLYQYDNDGILFKVKIYKNGIYSSEGQI